jgi:PAS domain-containing protein
MFSSSPSNDFQGQEHLVEELSAVIDNLVDGLLVTDTAGRITRFNAALSVMLGLQEIPHVGARLSGSVTAGVGRSHRPVSASTD